MYTILFPTIPVNCLDRKTYDLKQKLENKA